MRMRIASLGVLLALFAGGVWVLPARASESTLDAFKEKVLAAEKRGAWKKIAWQSDWKAVLKKSKKDNKPILCVLIVGHRARKNAAEC